MAKEHDLGFATGMRSEQSDVPSTEQFNEVDHPGNATALLRLCQPGSDFGRHKPFYNFVAVVQSATTAGLPQCARTTCEKPRSQLHSSA